MHGPLYVKYMYCFHICNLLKFTKRELVQNSVQGPAVVNMAMDFIEFQGE
jgi:hypothetical protein